MKRLFLLMVVVSLVAMPAAAQFQQLIEVQVKPGHEIAYENFMKKIAEAADKTGSSMSWSTFQVAVGKPMGTYRIGLAFADWGERDSWQAARQVLVEAFGEKEGSTIFTEGSSHARHSATRIWEVIEDGTANPQTGTASSAFYDVTVISVKREMIGEYRGLLRRFKSAYENGDRKPSFTRWVLRFGSGQGTTFRTTRPFDTWGEREGWNPGELINKQFGADAPLLFERFRAAVVKSEHFISAHRPDLSRTATSSTSND